MTRRRSARAPRTAVSAAATGEPSRDTAAATGPQQEEAAAATTTTLSQVLVPCAPSQGCGQAHSESRSVGNQKAAGAAADDDALPGWGQLRGNPGRPRSAHRRRW
jgi:hypothetical protein